MQAIVRECITAFSVIQVSDVIDVQNLIT